MSDKHNARIKGRFAPGNKLWMRRDKNTGHRPRIFNSGEELWAKALEYFEWVYENPMMEDSVIAYKGKPIHTPTRKMRAMTIEGLRVFIGVDRTSWYNWRKDDILGGTVELIEDVMHAYCVEGAAAGMLNAQIISRKLGMKEETETTLKTRPGQPFETKSTFVFEGVNADSDDSSD